MKSKQIFTGVLGAIGFAALILDSRTGFQSAAAGVRQCTEVLIPSLFPFFIVSSLLTQSLAGLNMTMLKPAAKLFHIPPGGEGILVCTFLGGYPMGAQSIAKLHKSGNIGEEDARKMLAYCSQAGPSFLFGILMPQFEDRSWVWKLWLVLIASAWMVSCFYPCGSIRQAVSGKPQNMQQILAGSVKAMGHVCGWVVLFRTITGFADRWLGWALPQWLRILFCGGLELSNGLCQAAKIDDPGVRFVICAVLLTGGGICVAMQTVSVIGTLSAGNYFIGKGLQVIFALILSLILVSRYCVFPFCGVMILFYFLFHSKKLSRNPAKAIV